MTTPCPVDFVSEDLSALKDRTGTIVVFCDADGKLGAAASAVDGLTGGQLSRLTGDDDYKAAANRVNTLNFPAGMAAP